MRKRLFATVITICLGVAVVATAATTPESKIPKLEGGPEQIATEIVHEFFGAIETKNYELAYQLVNDTRFIDKDVQIDFYDEMNGTTNFESIAITNTVVLSDSLVALTVEEDDYPYEVTVEKIDNNWKLVLGEDNPSEVAAYSPTN